MSSKYEVSDYFMIRTPLLSIDNYFKMFTNPNLDQSLIVQFNNPHVKEALAIASTDLLEAFEKIDLGCDSKAAKQMRSSLIKYFIRLSTRPTPFGLFSAVSMGTFSEKNDIRLDTKNFIKVARPDMEWIYALIKKLEENVYIKNYLRVRFNDFTYRKGNRLENPSKTVLQDGVDHQLTSIRYTNPVRHIEGKGMKFSPYNDLLKDLVLQNKNASQEQIESFLSQLLENEYLLSELRPPLTNTDVLTYMIDILSNISVDAAVEYVEKLTTIKNSIVNYSEADNEKGLDNYQSTIELMKDLTSAKNYLQVDMKANLTFNSIDSKLKDDLNEFANALLKLAPDAMLSDEMTTYRDEFLEKYGYDEEAPLLELLDNDKGLGVPAHFNFGVSAKKVFSYPKNAKMHKLRNFLNEQISMCLKEGETTFELSDDHIEFINQDHEKQPINMLPSFELYLLAHPKEEYTFTVSSGIASNAVGKSFGRFGHLFASDETSGLTDDYNKMIELCEDSIIAEVSELPSKGRISNVSITKSEYDYVIPFSTNLHFEKKVISVNDLLIGLDYNTNSFYIKSRSLNKRIVATMTSMLNPMIGSHASRFLREISSIYRTNPLDSLITILESSFVYTPRIVYKKIIVKPQSWLLSKSTIGFDKGEKSKFISHLSHYIEQLKVPKYVFLNENDHRLLLDLENSAHLNEIYYTLNKGVGKVVTLTEADFVLLGNLTTNEASERYVTEIVVPFLLNKPEKKVANQIEASAVSTRSDISRNVAVFNQDDLILFPGKSNWLFFKLYGGSTRIDELLCELHEKLESISSLLQKYFFIRYRDPDEHIRLRLHCKDESLSQVFSNSSKWFEALRSDGLIFRVVIDTYKRETVRYGGLQLIDLAEAHFHYSSQIVISIIRKIRYEGLDIDKEIITASFMMIVLKTFGLNDSEKKTFLGADNKQYRKEFRQNREKFMMAMDDRNDWESIREIASYSEVYIALLKLSFQLKIYAEAIFSCDIKGMLTNPIDRIMKSIIHMFCNRLVGDNNWERKMYHITGHAFYALRGYQKSQQKRKGSA